MEPGDLTVEKADELLQGETDTRAALSGESEFGAEKADLTLDDIFDDHNDVEAIKAAERAMALPQGNYTTVPEFKVSIKDDKTGRRYAMLSGKVQNVDEAGKITQGTINYFLSWQPKNSNVWENGVDTGVDSGKPDAKTKLFIQARKAYLKAFGESAVVDEKTGFPPTRNVIQFLSEFEHRVFILARDGQDSRVASISAVVSA